MGSSNYRAPSILCSEKQKPQCDPFWLRLKPNQIVMRVLLRPVRVFKRKLEEIDEDEEVRTSKIRKVESSHALLCSHVESSREKREAELMDRVEVSERTIKKFKRLSC